MDEAIATVATVTGATPELAAQYVQLADGDANQAVQLFFENGGADLAGSSAPQPVPPTTSRQSGDAQNPIDLDDEENITDDNDPEVTGFRKSTQRNAPSQPTTTSDFQDDEAMARRLQEEMYGEGGVDEPIRAPIARQAETLVGAGAGSLPLSGAAYDAAVEARMQAFERRRHPSPFDLEILENMTNETQCVLASSTNTNPRLVFGIGT